LIDREGKIYVPGDFDTINEAYKFIEKNQSFMFDENGEIVKSSSESSVTNRLFHTIVLRPREHVVEDDEDGDNLLRIKCPVTIVGDPNAEKEYITVIGGFIIDANGAHVEHLTIHNDRGYGVWGHSYCTLTDLIIDNCLRTGVLAVDSAVLNCTNIIVSNGLCEGVCAWHGGTIILRGNRTQITGNCLDGFSGYNGLSVWGSESSKIQIVSPLTKEDISFDNYGGQNWGADGDATLDQIEIIVTHASRLMIAKKLSLSPKKYAKIKATVIDLLKVGASQRTEAKQSLDKDLLLKHYVKEYAEIEDPPTYRLMEAKELLDMKLLSPKEYDDIEATIKGVSGGSGGSGGSKSGGSKSGGSGYRFRFRF